jgi:hypothetical protein
MFTASVPLALTLATLTASGRPTPAPRLHFARPRVEVWTNRGDDVALRGDQVRVFFRTDLDGFVTVFRVDTDGRVRVLFPREPWEDTFVRRDRELEIEGHGGRDAFTVDDYPGVGYVFAVVAADPFDYRAVVSGDHWDYRLIADGRVRGDPYVALTDLAQRIVPPGYEDWDYDLIPYYVERHYDYPRFACYDCHTYASWTYWDPYAYDCVRFRLVIYDDPWYYPYYYYGGTSVVWVRPYAPPPRYVFREWGGASRDQFITRVRQRPAGETRERTRPITRPAGIPTPRTRDRTGGGGGDDDDRPDDRPDRPDDRPDRPHDRPDRPGRRDRPDRPDRPDDRGSAVTSVPATPLSQPRTTGRGSAAVETSRGRGTESGRGGAALETSRARDAERGRGSAARETTGSLKAAPSRGSREEGQGVTGRGSRENARSVEPRGEGRGQEPREAPSSGARGQDRGAERREAPSAGSRESRGGERSGSGSVSRPSREGSSGGNSTRGSGEGSQRSSPSRGGGTPELKRRKP